MVGPRYSIIRRSPISLCLVVVALLGIVSAAECSEALVFETNRQMFVNILFQFAHFCFVLLSQLSGKRLRGKFWGKWVDRMRNRDLSKETEMRIIKASHNTEIARDNKLHLKHV